MILTVMCCSSPEETGIRTKGREIVSFSALPFSLTDVKLLEGPFLHATELNVNTLLGYKPDRLLQNFTLKPG
jgi:hypothetical protein